MRNTLIDAGPVIALFDKNDAWHERVINFLKNFDGTLLTTWPVITEISHLLSFNTQVQLDFLTWLDRGGVNIADIRQPQLNRILRLSEKYADLPMDLADASLVVVAEELGLTRIITIDRDFEVYRVSGQYRFENLLAESR